MAEQETADQAHQFMLEATIALKAVWGNKMTDELSEILVGAGFGPEGPNLSFSKSSTRMLIVIRGSGSFDMVRYNVQALIEDYLKGKFGFSLQSLHVYPNND
jgi:hypothetical protein